METPNLKQDALFTHFGLCPEYKVMQTEGEWVEYYEPPENVRMALWDKLPEVSKIYPDKTRLHLNVHYVELDNGVSLSARFAVSHTIKTIFLQVSPISGEFGKLSQEMLKYYG
jgi:hypothetical protein